MLPSSSIYTSSILCEGYQVPVGDCKHTYSVSSSGVITSNTREGELLISYKAFPRDEEGNLLIPDNEDFKEAIFNFVLHRYFLSKVNSGKRQYKEDRDYYRKEFHRAAMKSKTMNAPDLGSIENIKNQAAGLVKPSYGYDSGFATISSKENIRH